MKNLRNISWGIILIAIGLILGLNSLGVIDINLFFDGWWTLFIIIPSVVGLFNDQDKKGNLIGIIIGVLLLLACQNIINFGNVWAILFPIILIFIGVEYIIKNNKNKDTYKKIDKLNNKKGNIPEYAVAFSGQKINIKEKFSGCILSAAFGGIDFDLSKATIEKDAVINIGAVFGGINLILPEDVNIVINSTSIFGGVSNKNRKEVNSKITIYINAKCLFGGVEIK